MVEALADLPGTALSAAGLRSRFRILESCIFYSPLDVWVRRNRLRPAAVWTSAWMSDRSACSSGSCARPNSVVFPLTAMLATRRPEASSEIAFSIFARSVSVYAMMRTSWKNSNEQSIDAVDAMEQWTLWNFFLGGTKKSPRNRGLFLNSRTSGYVSRKPSKP